jgi:hypothetical protein
MSVPLTTDDVDGPQDSRRAAQQAESGMRGFIASAGAEAKAFLSAAFRRPSAEKGKRNKAPDFEPFSPNRVLRALESHVAALRSEFETAGRTDQARVARLKEKVDLMEADLIRLRDEIAKRGLAGS